MGMLVYNRDNCMPSVTLTGQKSIRMDRLGNISVTGALVPILGLHEGSMVALVGDEDDPGLWYICLVEDRPGFPVRLDKSKRNNHKNMEEGFCYGAIFNCRYLCNKILDNVGADKSATFMLATTPVEMEGLKLYRIITSNPITRPGRKYIKKKDRTKMEI